MAAFIKYDTVFNGLYIGTGTSLEEESYKC